MPRRILLWVDSPTHIDSELEMMVRGVLMHDWNDADNIVEVVCSGVGGCRSGTMIGHIGIQMSGNRTEWRGK